MIYYVSTNGSDSANGSIEAPFRTINRAAEVARNGDTVRVYGGTYREWVNPQFGGTSEHSRITYEAVEGERPIIKGSEIVTDWEKVAGTVWKKVLPNKMFGDWNPYLLEVGGDWHFQPYDEYRAHLGDVYINGTPMFEAKSMEDLYDNTPRITWFQHDMKVENELILHPEQTIYKWFASVDDDTTTIYCNFQEYNPNVELIEINVRPCCFYPKKAGVNYITLRGFEIAHAASPWAPPTAHQIAMVGPHWSKKWIIENNDLHDAKCCAVSLGKGEGAADHPYTNIHRKTGYRYQVETLFTLIKNGCDKDTIGSHIVRNNAIHDCGQAGVVGHLGCVFSTIEHNHIYNIAIKHEFWGYEIAGIKFHGAIDSLIQNNNIHDCTLGVWLDWEAQGSRLTKNIFHRNNRDLMLEVCHGPCLIDHNVFTAEYAFDYWAQGGALVHNIFCGKIRNDKVLDRNTPYHFPHSLNVLGYSEIYTGDDRYYNNMFVGQFPDRGENLKQFTKNCDEMTSPEEYEAVLASQPKREGKFFFTPQPVWIDGNAYSGYATPSKHEKSGVVAAGLTAAIEREEGKWILTMNVPKEIAEMSCKPVSTKRLGQTRMSAMAFEAPDGSDYDFSKDLVGEQYNGPIAPGPIANLQAGKQSIVVWEE